MRQKTIRMEQNHLSINVGGRLMDLQRPRVMGILNVTPDSFFASSRTQTEAEIAQRALEIAEEGGDIIDVGAYSTRPGATDISEEEELRRLQFALQIVRRELPKAVISVDTFRASVAKICVEEEGAHIINDISGGEIDHEMFRTVARLGVPYILTHINGTPQTMQNVQCKEDVLHELFLYFARKLMILRQLGAKDVILDPGFGFGKTLEQNYQIMSHLQDFHEFGIPLLVGVSRKSMVYKLLDATPEEALTGTTALHAVALSKNCHFLRVHDVKAARETVEIHLALQRNK